jgi:nucleotide-binding universal stress UspA family protein
VSGRAGFEAEARTDLAAPTWEGIIEVADEIDAAVIVIGREGCGESASCSRGASRMTSPSMLDAPS